ncbi:methyl-accepting chemotaxis protein, partial [Kineococcus glutinatus]|uniref:methyl-accepting chemotaxis protein n=1 Tax=Kineococcus glutinatus TaxID=1070872 RepID=UPI0031E53D10
MAGTDAGRGAPAGRRGRFADFSVHTKILTSLGLVAAVAVGVNALAIDRMATMDENLERIEQRHVTGLRLLNDVRGDLTRSYYQMNSFFAIVNSDPAVAQAMVPDIKQAEQDALDAVDAYAVNGVHTEARDAAVEAFLENTTYYITLRNILAFHEAPPAGFVMPAGDQVGPTFGRTQAAMLDAVDALQEVEEAEARALSADAAAQYDTARTQTLVALAFGLVIALALGLAVARSINRPLRQVQDALRGLADGDLTQQVPVTSRDELGQMAQAVNDATTGIRRMVSSLVGSAQTIAGSSEQLTAMSGRIAALAAETGTQVRMVAGAADDVSTDVQTVAAGGDEMGLAIGEISTNANQAVVVAAEAVSVADSANATIGKLGASSREIGDVLQLITAIAEQTNLLALNATIEAARAGEM